jgi:hypothetical protein
MASLADHSSNDFVKLLLIGDAKSGKTGSLVSLVKAGYKLRILDFDNLLDVLKQYVLKECPELIGNIEYRTLRDKRVAGSLGLTIKGTPKAYVDGIKLLQNWKYDDVDLGVPADWGPDTILVIDSLSRICDAAYDWQDAVMPSGKSGEKDGRAVYGAAQDAIVDLLSMLTGEGMETNVIVIAHGQYYDLPDGSTKIFPQGVGQKLSPKIPQFFPNVIRYKNSGGKRTVQLKSDALIDLANAAPFSMPDTLDIETGLAQIFEVLRGPLKQETSPPKPKSLTLKRA